MVSSQVIEVGTLRQLLTHLEHSSIDVNVYAGRVADAAFELQTFDTFIAGVAMTLVSGSNVTPEHKKILERALPLRDSKWVLDSGEEVDLGPFPELLAHARLVEAVRLAGLKQNRN